MNNLMDYMDSRTTTVMIPYADAHFYAHLEKECARTREGEALA